MENMKRGVIGFELTMKEVGRLCTWLEWLFLFVSLFFLLSDPHLTESQLVPDLMLLHHGNLPFSSTQFRGVNYSSLRFTSQTRLPIIIVRAQG